MRHYGILASKNKAKELNQAKAYFNSKPWEKQEFTWKQIAASKLNLNPDQCSKCKKLTLEIIETLLPERGPPPQATQPNQNFIQKNTITTDI